MDHKSIGRFKYELKKSLALEDGFSCYYCDAKLSLEKLTLDHIYPKSKLSRNSMKGYSKNNSVLSCKPCNIKKGSRVISIEKFRQEIMGDLYFPKPFVKRMSQELRNKMDRKSAEIFARKVAIPKEVIIIKPTLWERILLEYKIFKWWLVKIIK